MIDVCMVLHLFIIHTHTCISTNVRLEEAYGAGKSVADVRAAFSDMKKTTEVQLDQSD